MAAKRKLAVAEPETTTRSVPGKTGVGVGVGVVDDGQQRRSSPQPQRRSSSPQQGPKEWQQEQQGTRGSSEQPANTAPISLARVENYPRKRISIAQEAKLAAAAAPTTTTATATATAGGAAVNITAPVSPKCVASLEKRLEELEAKWAELERQKFETLVTPSTPLAVASPSSNFFGRSASSAGVQLAPVCGTGSGGMMALPTVLDGLSPPSSATEAGNTGYRGRTTTAEPAKDSTATTDGHYPRQLSSHNSHHGPHGHHHHHHHQHHARQESVTSSVPSVISSGHTPTFSGYPHKRRTTRNQFTARPSLVTFECPSYVPSESYDDSGEFYDAEMAAGDEFKRQMGPFLAVFPDVSNRTVRLILQKFVENFLGWMPLFEPTAVYTVVHSACASGFAPADPNSCLAMLILATGTLLQNHTDIRANPLPGLDYFAHGSRLLEQFSFLSCSLTTLHCRILQSTYFKLTLHPLLSWNVIMQGTRDCMNVLSSRWFKNLDLPAREPWHRAFWACSIMADEFEAALRLYTIGHRLYHEIVPLPRFENEDTGFYYFLAQISLRKLVTDTLDVVGYHDGKVIYAPVVTTELRNQAAEWHRHLPVAIRFPLDNSPLFDARKSFLRLQFFSLSTVLEWASVLRVMEAFGTARAASDDIALARLEATECFRCCTLYLDVAAEQLLGWQLGTSTSLWTTFAFVAMLIVSHKAPALAFIPTTRDESYIRNALELLRPWSHLPYVAVALNRMTGMMERIGISV
ncbi:hypothetical protein SPI_01969 [Niveomyces insectorum RCEF 264]|uniref:Transcription factor domain-containing protein n=1 Tax=Niveomyces insectorum RCEF 264 TaxID=1081102 RepID=A0A162J871_9HYPO|nr:hypothetical protein SPI_01969 [Niveomyces insectorum RCEF 264]